MKRQVLFGVLLVFIASLSVLGSHTAFRLMAPCSSQSVADFPQSPMTFTEIIHVHIPFEFLSLVCFIVNNIISEQCVFI